MSKSDIKKNSISQAGWLSVILMGCLFLLAFFPEVRMGPFHMVRINVLNDIQQGPPVIISKPDSLEDIKIDSVAITITPPPARRIEDYSGDENILQYFYKALEKSNKRPVRIAFYGDSFIEGDIISASFRDTLQKKFGGNGVGLVPLASETAGFRRSIKHTYSNWSTITMISPNANVPIGISGYTFMPGENNSATYKPGKIPPQPNFKRARVFYQNTASEKAIYYKINNGPALSQQLSTSNQVEEITVEYDGIQTIQFQVEPIDNVLLYGVSFDDKQGVYIDNFSLRRNSGTSLSRLSPLLLKQFNRYLDYKLIILQYGLNVATDTESTNYGWYSGKMIALIKNLKKVFPETSILLVSVSDRSTHKDGKMITMDAIPKLRNAQREIARKSGIAFWDMFEAMGGENSIIGRTESIPPLAAKDYTHLTHLGGIDIGNKLAEALIYEMARHGK